LRFATLDDPQVAAITAAFHATSIRHRWHAL
jgi:hypothetical protein